MGNWKARAEKCSVGASGSLPPACAVVWLREVHSDVVLRGGRVQQHTGLPDLPLSDAARTLVPIGDIAALSDVIEQLVVRRASGGLDAAAIAGEAGNWTWSDFRIRIAAQARGVLG